MPRREKSSYALSRMRWRALRRSIATALSAIASECSPFPSQVDRTFYLCDRSPLPMRTILNRRVLFREVNERIREVNGAAGSRSERLDIFCECGFDCLQHLHLPAWVYEETRLEHD